MSKTYEELQKELAKTTTGIEKIKRRAGTWHEEVLKNRKHLKVLILQYERIIKEKNTIIKDYQDNAWKIVLVMVCNIGGDIKQKLHERLFSK